MKRLSMIIAAPLALLAGQATAHPHIFAEARLEVVSDDSGMITELRNVWRFDEIFSSSVLMDFDKNTNLKLDPDELAEVGKTVRDSLADFNYYMSVSENGKTIPVAKPDAINVDYKDGQLLMFFSVKPSEPMPLKGKLAFGVYDPTFYTSIDFNSDEDMATVGDGMKACKRAVVRPDPDQVLADNQSTLTDAFFSDPTGTNMSKLFATRLELTC
ncbi:DUF1007 domain-containing protein [Metarhizobium album]|uniref:DUF1007 domain-containing protein n=1 Tax=Metarhizobium album TaxID=2182425 RepID=A0A2U2DVS5_9HYPH|nr:DUF1007 family protein [Rhizobium album]PWE57397.1 DUF1007 domain-containing protein [Rhizobium album]